MSLTQSIKEEARRLGFRLAGFTTPDPPPHWPVFQNWLAMGRNAGMGYMADPRRADSRLLLPECRSILMLAAPYMAPAKLHQNDPSRPAGRVAAYAVGDDYHLVLPGKLKTLADFIQKQAGGSFPVRWFTDSVPLLERDLAQRAGLGWIGRNTCLINPALGSYFFLAEILLGIELESDLPFTADRCGTCRRCIEACPTACILPDRTMDARRCIAYLTIENRQAIPSDLRSQVGERVFGCDACQTACPWNRRPAEEVDAAFSPRPGLPDADLLIQLGLSRQEFNTVYKDSPILRARWNGYLRNVAVVMGNRGQPAAIPTLQQAAKSDDPLIREHATWALEQIAREKGLDPDSPKKGEH
jgi:epoxyqueuosine reductase